MTLKNIVGQCVHSLLINDKEMNFKEKSCNQHITVGNKQDYGRKMQGIFVKVNNNIKTTPNSNAVLFF